MSDVFISHSRADKDIARGLADDLAGRGLQVWWDLELYAGRNFHDAILAALDASKVAIVVWSATAVKSPWVRDEATRAAKAAKLIATHIEGFDLDDIPLGMGQLQCVPVANRSEVYRALVNHGLSVSQPEVNKLNQPDNQLTIDELLQKYATYQHGPINEAFANAARQIEVEFFEWKHNRAILDALANLHKLLCFLRTAAPLPTKAIHYRLVGHVATAMQELMMLGFPTPRTTKLNNLLSGIMKLVPHSPRSHH
jgi:hypothetical protein